MSEEVKLAERLTYHVRRAMPADWVAHKPLAFEGNRPGQFIARISGDIGGTRIPTAKSMGRYFELEGYGVSEAAAIQDLLTKLDAAERMGRA